MRIERVGPAADQTQLISELPFGAVFHLPACPDQLHIKLQRAADDSGCAFAELYGNYDLYGSDTWYNMRVVVVPTTLKVYS
jgi:hypothetical protein